MVAGPRRCCSVKKWPPPTLCRIGRDFSIHTGFCNSSDRKRITKGRKNENAKRKAGWLLRRRDFVPSVLAGFRVCALSPFRNHRNNHANVSKDARKALGGNARDRIR